MNHVLKLYRQLRDGLEMTPGPEDHSFHKMWELYGDVTSLAGVRFMEPDVGPYIEAAEEVRLYLERFDRVSHISQGMPVHVPETTVRALRALRQHLSETTSVEELAEFFCLASPIANDLAGFAVTQLGEQFAAPIVDGLTVVARAGSLMCDQLPRTIPALER